MIRYEKRAWRGLQQNLTIKEVRAKYKAVSALMEPGEQFAAYFKGRSAVRSAFLYLRKGETNSSHLIEGYTHWRRAAAPRCAPRRRSRSRLLALTLHVLTKARVEPQRDGGAARVRRPDATPLGTRTRQRQRRAGRAPKWSLSRSARTRSQVAMMATQELNL